MCASTDLVAAVAESSVRVFVQYSSVLLQTRGCGDGACLLLGFAVGLSGVDDCFSSAGFDDGVIVGSQTFSGKKRPMELLWPSDVFLRR